MTQTVPWPVDQLGPCYDEVHWGTLHDAQRKRKILYETGGREQLKTAAAAAAAELAAVAAAAAATPAAAQKAAEQAAWAEFKHANPQLSYVRSGQKATWKKLHWVPAAAAAAAP